MKYLSQANLTRLWAKIKEYVTSAVNTAKTAVGNYTVNGKKISTNPTLGKADVGLGNVDNTADASKPVSTPQKTYIDTQVGTRIASSLKGAANGVATLNSEGVLSSDQCPALKTINGHTLYGEGNVEIDLSLYKVVTTLPTTGIEANKIYLVLSGTSGTQNKYTEYIYTGNPAGTYSASAWEKIGEYTAKVDLTPYMKKEGLPDHVIIATGAASPGTETVELNFNREYLDPSTGKYAPETSDGIDIPAATKTAAGVMSAADKTKLDNIASGATADSAMTDEEIDAICV